MSTSEENTLSVDKNIPKHFFNYTRKKELYQDIGGKDEKKEIIIPSM